MESIFDVWVNWSDGSARSYGVPYYYEWQQQEPPEIMERLPIVYVTTEFYNYVVDGYEYIPEELLEMVHNKARKVVKQRNVNLEYAFILTDGKGVMAINTDGTDRPSYKSRLVVLQEEMVLRRIEGTEQQVFHMLYEHKRKPCALHEAILDIKTEYMVGLTRTEREMKIIVLDCLYTIACSDDMDELIYWYTEMFPEISFTAPSLRKVGRDPVVQAMFDFLKEGWSPRHEAFGESLIVYYELYKDTWQKLVKEKQEPIPN